VKKLIPYLKLVRLVKWQFAAALVCAMIYGASSGFGLPFMTRKVFPVLFPEDTGVPSSFTLAGEDFYLPVSYEEVATLDLPIFTQMADQGFTPSTNVYYTNERGDLLAGNPTGVIEVVREPLFVEATKGEYLRLRGGIYKQEPATGGYTRQYTEPFTPPSRWVLIGAVVLLPITMLVRGASGFANTYLINYCGIKVLEHIRMLVFDKLQSLPIAFFHRHKSGDLLSRVLGDTVALQNSVILIANDLVKQPVTLIGAVTYLVYQSFVERETSFILLSFAVIGICIFPIRFIGRKLVKKVYAMQEQLGSLSAVLSENLSSTREIRAFNLQQKESTAFRQTTNRFLNLQMKVVKYTNVLSPAVEIISSFGIAGAIYYSAQKGVRLQDIIPLMFALYLSYAPIKKLGAINNTAKHGIAGIMRLEFILDQPDSTPDPAEPKAVPSTVETVAFKQVSFRYEDEPTLSEVHVNVRAGEVVALVGPSGAGKSTFANLIPRFYDVQEGAVCLNDIDVREFTKADLRNHISLVSQDTFLFNDTIANNILIGRADASLDEVQEAARHAFAHDFISTMEKGYDTIVGERGTRLSGGQKQRIAIARAFLRHSPLLILDEATSALDSESESHIQKSLHELIKGKTVFIIAHRFSTLKFATRILVFDKGRIIADGPHEEVFASSALYRDLHQRQSG